MSKRAYAQLDCEMPLRRYFLFAGGALLSLLLAANWLLPAPPPNELTTSHVNLPPIRLHSELEGPAAVVIDAGQSGSAPVTSHREVVISPDVASDVTTDEAAEPAHPLDQAPLAASEPPPAANEQRTAEPQPQNARRLRAAGLARPPASLRGSQLPSRPGEPMLASGAGFRQSFAQLVPHSARQPGRGEAMAGKRAAAVAGSPLLFGPW